MKSSVVSDGQERRASPDGGLRWRGEDHVVVVVAGTERGFLTDANLLSQHLSDARPVVSLYLDSVTASDICSSERCPMKYSLLSRFDTKLQLEMCVTFCD